MRYQTVRKGNEHEFVYLSSAEYAKCSGISKMLEKIDKMLHDKDLEIVIGGWLNFFLRIDHCEVDEEYDMERTRAILYGKRSEDVRIGSKTCTRGSKEV